MQIRYRKGRIVGPYRGRILKQRRQAIYRHKAKFNKGLVPCFICGEHVEEHDASLEHIVPLSRRGTDSWTNLEISHTACNQERGNSKAQRKPRPPSVTKRKNRATIEPMKPKR